MARYIDAEQKITVTYYDEECEEWSKKTKTIDEFLYENCDDEIPTADVVKVVRCKDCKYSECWYKGVQRCFLWIEIGINVFNDGFCSYGERMNDEDHAKQSEEK